MELKSNIWKYNVYKSLRDLIFAMPIIAIFFLENGLDLKQIMIVQSAWAATLVLFEIPSGYFADRFGRKTSMVLGSLVMTIASLVYYFSSGFYYFISAEIMWGIGASFISGADTALIYDTLADLKRRKEYKKIEGHAFFLQRTFEAIAALIGGFIAVVSLRLTFLATTGSFFLMFLISLSLKEPNRHATIVEGDHLKHMYKILRFALHKNKVVKWLIIYSAMIALFGICAYWFIQPYMRMMDIPIAYFGAVFAVLGVIAGLSGKYSYLYEKRIGLKKAIISLPIISAITMFLLGKFVFEFTIIFFVGMVFVRGIEFPLISNLINKIVWPQNRATVLSISNLMSRLLFVIFGPLFGWFSDIYSIPYVYMLMSTIMLVLGSTTLIMLHKHKAI